MFDKRLINPQHHFYPDDDSFLRFEQAYYRVSKAPYPAWSLEDAFIEQLANSSINVIQLPAEESLDGRMYHFYFKQIYDNYGNCWYKFLTVKRR